MKHYGIFLLDEANKPDHLFTKIHGVWYDLAKYNHPGGQLAINLTDGRDSTVLFESHHLISKKNIKKVLEKYKVDEKTASALTTLDPKDDGAHYQWKDYGNNEFVQDLKSMLHSYFAPIAKQNNCTEFAAAKATYGRWSFLAILTTVFIATIPHYIQGYYWTLFATPFLSWVLIANYTHDAMHFSLSSDWRTNAALPYLLPILSSPWMWYHQHVIGHHAYTNVGRKDPDLAHAPQLKREHESIKWRKLHENQGTVRRIFLVWSVATMGMNILNDIKTNLKSSYNNVVGFKKLSQKRFILHLVGRFVYCVIMYFWPLFQFSFQKAIVWIIVPNTIFSCLFMGASQINHLSEDCSKSDENFLKHQVITAQNFGNKSNFWFIVSGGLNYQIEHHLFPFVNHCHLPFLAPKVKEICKKHNVEYKELSYSDAFNQHWLHTEQLAKPPISKAQ